MKTVWILFSIANEYGQPDRAFEALFWSKPTFEQLQVAGLADREATAVLIGGRQKVYETTYWLEKFTES